MRFRFPSFRIPSASEEFHKRRRESLRREQAVAQKRYEEEQRRQWEAERKYIADRLEAERRKYSESQDRTLQFKQYLARKDAEENRRELAARASRQLSR